MVVSLWRNRDLVKQMVKREVVGRYRGSFMGILWSFLRLCSCSHLQHLWFSFIFKKIEYIEQESKN